MPLQDRNAAWNPIMGAVDMVSQEIMQKRNLLRNAAMQNAAQQEQLARDQKLEGYKGRIKSLNDIMTSRDFTPETQNMAGQSLMKVISDPNFEPPADMPIQRQTVPLHPEVEKFFSGAPGFRPGVPVTPDVAEKLTQMYYDNAKMSRENEYNDARVQAEGKRADADLIRANAQRIRANRPVTPRTTKSQAPSMLKVSIDMLEGDNKTIVDLLNSGSEDMIKSLGGEQALMARYKQNQNKIALYRQEYLKQLKSEAGDGIDTEGIEEESELRYLFDELEEAIGKLK